jgi:hypothetical protein
MKARFITIALFTVAVAAAGCSKKKDDAAGSSGAKTAESAEPAKGESAEPAKGAGPVKTDPKALFDEFTDPKVDGMALIDKYHDGATFSGKVTVKATGEDGTPILWMELDGGRHIELGYTDAAKAKAVKNGDTVTVTCKIGGAVDKMMQVMDCQ